ncbi:Protein of unknown function [Geosporobacter subterraneus DSM 17957]|uniref:UPF0473 protein SAMN02745975_00084 n=1 Tax=Geosporobacter subterraneus DSM 17957 TaxID=1121919 RepID=A0A1M6BWR9_9FIRM|nr:DUF1292 domain-containing protein [Geosporobacter subterraneus]SHI53117.1 Protein of unknown function [Geosporobacter subterraneus DSM 17957]
MENENIVTLLDEEGKETDFEVIATLEVNESEYAILLPLDGDSEEAFIFRMIEENGSYSLECVEDDEEFNAVAAAYEELMQEEENDEEYE